MQGPELLSSHDGAGVPSELELTSPDPLTLSDYLIFDAILRDSLLPQLASLRGKRVLDVGCGRGLMARTLASLGVEVVALDLQQSADWRASSTRSPRYVMGRGERLPFKDNSFDAVLSNSAIQYQDLRHTLSEMIRVTRDRGVVLLHENMPHNPIVLAYRVVRKLQGMFRPEVAAYTATILRYLSPRRLTKELRIPGLHLTSSTPYYFFTPAFFLGSGVPGDSNFARALMAVDRALLKALPFLKPLSWFCAYRIEVRKRAPRALDQPATIGAHFKSHQDTRSSKYLWLAFASIVRQGRLAEAVYGAFCLGFYRPSALDAGPHDPGLIDDCLHQLTIIRTEIDGVRSLIATTPSLPSGFRSRRELFVRTDAGYVLGEYSEAGRSARLFHVVDGVAHEFDYYKHEPGVRHLHSIVDVGGGRLLVSTGDASKYLDEWRVRGTQLVFHRRLMRWLGGFTAYARIGETTYFGTDFSERPNYLLRLQDRKKFFLPAGSFRQFVVSMATHLERYLVCYCFSIYGATSVAIFDTKIEQFIYCTPAELPPSLVPL